MAFRVQKVFGTFEKGAPRSAPGQQHVLSPPNSIRFVMKQDLTPKSVFVLSWVWLILR